MPWTIEGSKTAAMTKRRCPFCGQRIRPCNMQRHLRAKHRHSTAGTTLGFRRD